MSKKTQQLLAFGFGVVFVIVLLALAVAFPTPSSFQYDIFKSVLALAAAGVAAMIPGFLVVTVGGWLRAGGAMAVFAVVYLHTPARLVATDPEPNPTAMFPIVLACKSVDVVKLNTFSFPFSDIKKKSDQKAFRTLLAQLPAQQCDQATSKIFRMKDETVLLSNSSLTATSGGNIGVIVLPTDVIDALGGDDHIAFTRVHAQAATHD
jgi:hypothetical protein